MAAKRNAKDSANSLPETPKGAPDAPPLSQEQELRRNPSRRRKSAEQEILFVEGGFPSSSSHSNLLTVPEEQSCAEGDGKDVPFYTVKL